MLQQTDLSHRPARDALALVSKQLLQRLAPAVVPLEDTLCITNTRIHNKRIRVLTQYHNFLRRSILCLVNGAVPAAGRGSICLGEGGRPGLLGTRKQARYVNKAGYCWYDLRPASNNPLAPVFVLVVSGSLGRPEDLRGGGGPHCIRISDLVCVRSRS